MAIELRNLAYSLDRFELPSLSVTLPKGQMTAIVGRNGSGKSTLLRLIARLLKPDSGEIFYDGEEGTAYTRKTFACKVSLLTQDKGSIPDITVRELVSYGRAPRQSMLQRRLSAEDEAAVTWALSTVGIRHNEDRMFHTLSGGEQQKARIAMAIAVESDIVLLDEPTTYLDLSHQLEVMEMLKRLNRQLGLTIIMVLHDLQQAAAYSHHLIAMDQGRIAACGPPRVVIDPRFLIEVFGVVAQVDFNGAYPMIAPIPQEEKECARMIIVTNVSQITKGNGEKLIERFNKVGKVEAMKGFLGLEVLLTDHKKDYDEVSVVTRWETKEDFQAWTTSEAFRESHAHREKPDYILDNKIVFQEVKVIRLPLPSVLAKAE